jgi:heme exporter protein B
MTSQRAFLAILFRDLKLSFRHLGDLLNPLLFFLMVVTLFPLALGPERDVLQQYSPAVIWVAVLLASSISLDTMFRSDMEDGSLEQILLSPQSDIILVSAKILAHWLIMGLPLTLCSLLLGILLYMPSVAYVPLLVTLLLGTPFISLVGSVAVALTVGLRAGGMLLVLIILPLYMPVLIIAISAVNNAMKDLPVSGEYYFLGAMFVIALTLAPFATAAALRIRMG